MSRDDPGRAEAALAEGFARLLALLEGRPAAEAAAALPPGFGLSRFEADLLLLLAGAEIDGAIAAAIAARPDAPGGPSFGLALAVLPGGHWSAIAPGGPLRRWRMIEVDGAAPLAAARLRIDERILQHLLGDDEPDARLAGIARRGGAVPLGPSQAAIAEALAAQAAVAPAFAVALSGDDGPAMEGIAARIAAACGRRLLRIDAALIPEAPAEGEALATLLDREVRLAGALPFIAAEDRLPTAAARLAERLDGPLVAAAGEPPALRRALRRADVRKPGPRERLALWRTELPGLPEADAARLAATYRIGAAAIAAEAATCGADRAAIDHGCRIAGAARLDAVATRVAVTTRLDELVLPAAERQLLAGIVAQMRARPIVDLAFPDGSRGLGLTVLFAGESGTGKTVAAEAVAGELGLDLYRVDLAQTVSKYIGETAKNLKTLFDAAEEAGAVLLFDEADALFGKRSEVRDAHDRYANIEVGYLLQRLEAYSGLAILTTNMRHALDPAFQRRIRFIVSFPFPDRDARAAIWARAFPPGIATGELLLARLGQLAASGGAIRVIALNAAFAAADEGVPVAMRHVLAAAHAEAAKRDRPLADAETRRWLS